MAADTMMDPTQANLERLIRAKENAVLLSEYAESVKCDASSIAGDRYKIRFSEHSEWGDR